MKTSRFHFYDIVTIFYGTVTTWNGTALSLYYDDTLTTIVKAQYIVMPMVEQCISIYGIVAPCIAIRIVSSDSYQYTALIDITFFTSKDNDLKFYCYFIT